MEIELIFNIFYLIKLNSRGVLIKKFKILAYFDQKLSEATSWNFLKN